MSQIVVNLRFPQLHLVIMTYPRVIFKNPPEKVIPNYCRLNTALLNWRIKLELQIFKKQTGTSLLSALLRNHIDLDPVTAEPYGTFFMSELKLELNHT